MDPSLVHALCWSLLAGLSIPVGAGLAMLPWLMPGWLSQPYHHSLVAFGGGALIGAVALVLVPEGSAKLPAWLAVCAFLVGGCLFCAADAWIGRSSKNLGQFLAMLLDYIPEAIALGAAFAQGTGTGMLLAFLIGIQNLPESFNAFRDMESSSRRQQWRILFIFMGLSLAGPLSAWLGYSYFSEAPVLLGVLMVGCAGGILYLCFQDIAPKVHVERHWSPPLGAVAGFGLAFIGHLLVDN